MKDSLLYLASVHEQILLFHIAEMCVAGLKLLLVILDIFGDLNFSYVINCAVYFQTIYSAA